MTLVGGTGTGSLAGILWATLGFALAECAVFLGAATTGRARRSGRTPSRSVPTCCWSASWCSTGSPAGRARRTDRPSTGRSATRGSSTCAGSCSGRLDRRAPRHRAERAARRRVGASRARWIARLAGRIEADLRTVGGGMVGADRPDRADTAGTADGADAATRRMPTTVWFDSELHQAIELARDEGLAVDVSGDRDALARLDAGRPSRRWARRPAVPRQRPPPLGQCHRRGGASRRPATPSRSWSWTRARVPCRRPAADRLGLRQSVHDRIERVGGTSTVYSSEDVGTTVLLVVPTARAAGTGESGVAAMTGLDQATIVRLALDGRRAHARSGSTRWARSPPG